ncbi:hypothetical protein ALQ92_200034 [Pseudomonas syringae pv. pisi]|nr:hypothetical protein ALQ92_200034 [Pseudomonas syringae pv. pisi]
MSHLVELFAANDIQNLISTDVTNALKRCVDPQFFGQHAVDRGALCTDLPSSSIGLRPQRQNG